MTVSSETYEGEPLLKPDEVARRLSIEEGTLAVWRSTKRQPLPYVRIGGAIRYRPADVLAFIASNRQVA